MTSTTKSFSLKSAAVILFALWLSIYFLGLGQTAITDPNEGYYIEAAREMVESGNWLVPHLNWQIYFSKPILTFWLIALAYKVFGVSEFSARIVFSLLALFLFSGVMLFARRLAGTRCGILAATICATAPLMMAASRISPIDVAFTCFLSLAIFVWILNHIFNNRQFWPYFYLFMALAVLTKGPASLLLILISTIVFLFVDFFISKKKSAPSVLIALIQKSAFKELVWGCLIFSVIAVPWYVAVGLATKGLFLKVFFLYENLARFAGQTNFTGSRWYHYFPVLIYSFLPWVLFLIPAIKYIFSQYLRKNIAGKEDEYSDRTIKALVYLSCYAVVLIFILSCSGTQLDTYLLPAIPPLSVVVGYYLDRACSAITSGTSSFPAIKAISLILAMLGGVLLLGLPVLMILPVAAIKKPFFTIMFISAIGFLIQYILNRKSKPWSMLTVFCLTTALTCILTFHVLCRLIDQSGQHDLKNLCLLYKRSRDHLSIFHAFKPSVLFYTERPVDSFFRLDQLIVQTGANQSNSAVASPDTRKLLLFICNQYLPRLTVVPHLVLKPLARRGNWLVLLVENASLKKQLTLENIFKQNTVNSNIFTQKSDWGPLTVPYAAGKQYTD